MWGCWEPALLSIPASPGHRSAEHSTCTSTSQQFARLRPPSNTSLPQQRPNLRLCCLKGARPISNVSAPHSPAPPASKDMWTFLNAQCRLWELISVFRSDPGRIFYLLPLNAIHGSKMSKCCYCSNFNSRFLRDLKYLEMPRDTSPPPPPQKKKLKST